MATSEALSASHFIFINLTGYKVYTYVEAIWPKSHGTKNEVLLAMTLTNESESERALLPRVLTHTRNRLD